MNVVGNASRQMMESISWLHSKGVVHRDIKGDNYLTDRQDLGDPECQIYLSDFGTATDVKESQRLHFKCGTATYWAPEFVKLDYSLKVDVWAFGVIMYGLITGRFPFKNEDDITHKKINIPSRANADCASLLLGLLERNESLRLTAAAALVHPFCAGAAEARTARKQTIEEMDFSPEVREQGAHTGIDKRRKELVGRLEEACGDGVKLALVTFKDLRQKNKYQLVQRQNDRTSELEWFSQERADQLNLHDHTNARPYQDDARSNAESSTADIKKTLEEHGISTDGFGTGKAKSCEEFVLEVQRGASRLMLDATQHKSLVRVVDSVLLRVMFMTRS